MRSLQYDEVCNEDLVDLRYLPRYQVLLCVSCGYCVIPDALDTHLKCIHRLVQAKRRPFLQRAQDFKLAQPANVIYPPADDPPLLGFPKLKGYVCEAALCTYKCATAKRMHAHWSDRHDNLRRILGIQHYQSRSATLQTFFRSRHLRYFEANSTLPSVHPEQVKLSLRNLSSSAIHTLIVHGGGKNELEYELLRQFRTVSFDGLRPVKGSRPDWKLQVLQRAVAHDFLLYAVLSATACHVAHLATGSQRADYAQVADTYRRAAVAVIPPWTASEQATNFFTHFNFIRLMGLSYLAREHMHLAELAQPTATTADADAGCVTLTQSILLDWVDVSRRGRELWFRHRGEGRVVDAMNGAANPLRAVVMNPESVFSLNPDDVHLEDLQRRLLSLPSDQVHTVHMAAFDLLRSVWAIPFRNETVGPRDMALMWIVRVSDEFIGLVRSYDPVALVILAHHCVLWSQAEDRCWYMSHHAEMALTKIAEYLPLQWQDWITWPLSVVFDTHDMPNQCLFQF